MTTVLALADAAAHLGILLTFGSLFGVLFMGAIDAALGGDNDE